MKLAVALCFATFALGGCAPLPKINEVDTSKAQPDCVRQCTGQYSSCMPPVLEPAVYRACHDAYQVCVNTCPAK